MIYIFRTCLERRCIETITTYTYKLTYAHILITKVNNNGLIYKQYNGHQTIKLLKCLRNICMYFIFKAIQCNSSYYTRVPFHKCL
jgi:hypothetical protein